MLAAAISHIAPSYPEESKARGATGVAVARLRTDTLGNVRRVEVLQAPDVGIGLAVQNVLGGWTFQRILGGPTGVPSQGLEGKVVLYFRILDGHGVVSVR